MKSLILRVLRSQGPCRSLEGWLALSQGRVICVRAARRNALLTAAYGIWARQLKRFQLQSEFESPIARYRRWSERDPTVSFALEICRTQETIKVAPNRRTPKTGAINACA